MQQNINILLLFYPKVSRRRHYASAESLRTPGQATTARRQWAKKSRKKVESRNSNLLNIIGEGTYSQPHHQNHPWRAACAHHAPGANQGREGACGMANTPNCLRHFGASYWLAATGNAPQTALELGTSVQMLMQHYRELVAKEDAESWFSIFPPKPSDGPGTKPATP